MEIVDINGAQYQILITPSNNRTAIAKLREDTILISVPSRWPNKEKERIVKSLQERAIKAIARGKWGGKKESRKRVEFSHGQKVTALGEEFNIQFLESESGQFYSKLHEGQIEIRAPNHPEKDKIASELARKHMTKKITPKLVDRVSTINERHFGSHIPKIILRDNLSRWGSCSADNRISLNFRLIFVPEEILDYVIVHELAHTKYRSHGKMFWRLVEKVVPDYRQRVKWLKENGWNYPLAAKAEENHDLKEFDQELLFDDLDSGIILQ
ncbi:M48 family metallopeptidase [Candidatus Micrarchaeota archaeon]|nr:M48 family metallopeptidase [Candidatus Micrarchaeota archaeon]